MQTKPLSDRRAAIAARKIHQAKLAKRFAKLDPMFAPLSTQAKNIMIADGIFTQHAFYLWVLKRDLVKLPRCGPHYATELTRFWNDNLKVLCHE